MSAPVGACLTLADISGYTRYLAGVELDHAQDILADLLGTVVDAFRPTFTLSKLEGDAVFLYRFDEAVDGSVLLDVIEGAYFAFQRRLVSIRQASLCECQACVMIGELNLKVVAHYGEVVEQTMVGVTELVGSDVVVVHRMLKNEVSIPAYAFITDRCIELSSLDPEALGMARHTESYQHIGEVTGWVHDLQRAWSEMMERNRVYVGDDDAVMSFQAFFPAPPQLVWEHISVPTLRVLWNTGLDRLDQLDPAGRRRTGTLNHCMHGQDVILQEFVDWQPPRYFTSRFTLPDGMVSVMTQEVEPVDGGSVLYERLAPPDNEDELQFIESLRPAYEENHRREVETLTTLLARAVEERAAVSEPPLPQSNEGVRLGTAVRSG